MDSFFMEAQCYEVKDNLVYQDNKRKTIMDNNEKA